MAEVTHVSDSAATQSQSTIDSLNRSLNLAHSAASQQSQRAGKAFAEYQKIKALLEEHIAALSALQYQYESRSRIIAQMRDANRELTASLDGAKLKIQNLSNDLTSNKEARKILESDLKEARLRLTDSSIPMVKGARRGDSYSYRYGRSFTEAAKEI